MRVALRLGGLILTTTLAGMPTVSAAADAEQQRIPAPNAFSPCTNEAVLTTGTQHLVTILTARQSHLHFNFQDVKGVGARTGLTYVVTGAAQLRLESNQRGQAQFVIISVLHVIAPGTHNNFISKVVFRLHRTPSGHTKVVVHSMSRCTGSTGGARVATLAPGLAPAALADKTLPVSRGMTSASTATTGATRPRADSPATAPASKKSRPDPRVRSTARPGAAH